MRKAGRDIPQKTNWKVLNLLDLLLKSTYASFSVVLSHKSSKHIGVFGMNSCVSNMQQKQFF